jgi:hypothetical protein
LITKILTATDGSEIALRGVLVGRFYQRRVPPEIRRRSDLLYFKSLYAWTFLLSANSWHVSIKRLAREGRLPK